jgi:SPP1 family phage portal protein
LNREVELDARLLNKMINRFNIGVKPKLERSKEYYDGIQLILRKSYADENKPCSRTVVNYCKNIVDSYAGYLATPGFISYQSENDIEEIMNVLRYNDYQTEDNEFLNDALIYGVAAELMYLDANSQVRFRIINPTTCFGIYDDSLTGDLMYFVRMYKVNEWDETDTYNVDVYSDYDIKHYQMNGFNGNVTFLG